MAITGPIHHHHHQTSLRPNKLYGNHKNNDYDDDTEIKALTRSLRVYVVPDDNSVENAFNANSAHNVNVNANGNENDPMICSIQNVNAFFKWYLFNESHFLFSTFEFSILNAIANINVISYSKIIEKWLRIFFNRNLFLSLSLSLSRQSERTSTYNRLLQCTTPSDHHSLEAAVKNMPFSCERFFPHTNAIRIFV